MPNPLRSPDPVNQFRPEQLINEADTGIRHPGRFEPRTASIPNTQLVRNDAVRVYRNAALSVTNGDIVPWDSKTFDTTGVWNGATSLIIPTTGKSTGAWRITAQIVWPGTGAGTFRQLEIRKNGSVITTTASLATITYQLITDVVYDTSRSDVFTITVAHDAGAPLALTVGSNNMFYSMIHAE